MSIGVMISVHDGLVLAADSASTLMFPNPQGGAVVGNVYDNANKIFNLYKGRPLGCVTFGAGSIGNASIGTLIKDLRANLSSHEKDSRNSGFDPDSYTMEQVAKIITDFLGAECSRLHEPAALQSVDIGILLGGYSTGESLGEVWSVEIQKGVPKKPVRVRERDQCGINWGGSDEVLHRIVFGFSPVIFQVLAEVNNSPGSQVSSEQLYRELFPLLSAKLQAQILFPPMPIQDAIDLARFLVNCAIMYSRFLPGAQVVGGPIEIAAITKHEGFKWINRKHYYDEEHNREPMHVVVDQ